MESKFSCDLGTIGNVTVFCDVLSPVAELRLNPYMRIHTYAYTNTHIYKHTHIQTHTYISSHVRIS